MNVEWLLLLRDSFTVLRRTPFTCFMIFCLSGVCNILVSHSTFICFTFTSSMALSHEYEEVQVGDREGEGTPIRLDYR